MRERKLVDENGWKRLLRTWSNCENAANKPWSVAWQPSSLAQSSMATFLSPHSPSESLFWILPSLKFVLALSPSPTSSLARFLLLGSFSPCTIFLLTSHSLSRQHLLPDSPFSRLPPLFSSSSHLLSPFSLLPPRLFTFSPSLSILLPLSLSKPTALSLSLSPPLDFSFPLAIPL